MSGTVTVARIGATATLVAAAAAIGVLDFVTPPDINLSLVYFVPIVAAGLWIGQGAAVATALAGCIGWVGAVLEWDLAHVTAHMLAWDLTSRLATYGGVGLLVSRVRIDRQRLQDANARLRELLEGAERQARTDALTGLANPRNFFERLDGDLALDGGPPVVLAYLDLDNFKSVNDQYGHGRGDQVLRRVADAIRRAIRPGDLAARLGGDEFAIVFQAMPVAHAEEVARRLIEQVDELGRSLPLARLGASVGIAMSPPACSAEDLLRRADEALYDSKARGKGQVETWRAATADVPGATMAAAAARVRVGGKAGIP